MKLLVINACEKKNSRTLELTKNIIDLFENKYDIEYINTYELPINYINNEIIEKRDKKEYNPLVLNYVNKIKEADRIIVSAPVWDMSFPASLKVFIENVNLVDYLFKYTEKGSIGLVKAKKLLYVSTSGGPYVNLGYLEFEMIARLWGIEDVSNVFIDLVDVVPNRFEIEKARLLKDIKNKIKEF